MFAVRGGSDVPGGLSMNTVLLHQFEQSYSHSAGGGGMSTSSQEMSLAPTKNTNMLYCISGHRISSGQLPDRSVGSATAVQFAPAGGKYSRDSVDRGDEFRLEQTYLTDRSGLKISKNRLHVASAALLPLRRLLMLGADDGTVKVVC